MERKLNNMLFEAWIGFFCVLGIWNTLDKMIAHPFQLLFKYKDELKTTEDIIGKVIIPVAIASFINFGLIATFCYIFYYFIIQ